MLPLFSKRMASTNKYATYDFVLDDIISTVRGSHFGKPVDDQFLKDLRFLMKNKMKPRLMKPAPAPLKSVLNTEFDCLPLPNEILVKIFRYLNIQDISRCSQISHQFNMISKDSILWQSWAKLSIYEMKVPTEFLIYIIQRGITELKLYKCEILPPRAMLTVLTRPLNLKTLSLDNTKGDKTLANEILTSHPMEKVDFRGSMMSENDIEALYFVISEYKELCTTKKFRRKYFTLVCCYSMRLLFMNLFHFV